MSQRSSRSMVLAAALVALVLAAAAAHAQGKGSVAPTGIAGPDVASRSGPSDSATARRAEYGITLAMTGEYRGAENVFASLLSTSPGAAQALTNLGNLRVLNGDLDVALAFYDQALRADPRDAGIVLNRATTLMLMGDAEEAEAEAAHGVALAGGEAEAARLLGLSTAKPRPSERGSDKPFVSKQEVLSLLRAAAARVPGDSSKAAAAPDSAKVLVKPKRPAKTWRSAGPRAGAGDEIASVLYWKK